jgi:hypothetical protein
MAEAASISLGKDFARALSPVLLARDCGINPDPVQAKILASNSSRLLLNCSRQWGKSTTAALIALHVALYDAPAMIALIRVSRRAPNCSRKFMVFGRSFPALRRPSRRR